MSSRMDSMERGKELHMFKHILLPTDGSELSNAAIHNGIQFAKSINAKVTGLSVIVPSHTLILSPEIFRNNEDKYYEDSRIQVENYLAVITRVAQEAGVVCDTAYVTAPLAYEAIIKFAEQQGCDLILMASHGRKGMQGLLIGSETAKVLTHTKLPVLVYR
jgi:nucleotide-binding universal stress UspA family protein